MDHNIWTQHSYTQKVSSQTMGKPDYRQVTESRIHSWITVSGNSTVIHRRFIITRYVNETTAKLVNHQYKAGSHSWITVSGHSTLIGFLLRRCVNQTTARSLNPESKSSSQLWTHHSYTQKVYNRTRCKPDYSQVTESRIHSWITYLDDSIWTQQSYTQKVYNQTMCKADYSQVTQSHIKIYFAEGL